MRYITSALQQDYFKNEEFIEFEAFLNHEEAEKLKTLLDAALAKIPTKSPSKHLLEGRDLFREDPALHQATHLSRWGHIAASLFDKKRLKLAYAQYFPCFAKTASLEEISSFTGICGGGLLNLSKTVSSELSIIPKAFGSATFFKPTLQIAFSELNFPLLLFAFADERARYKYQESDPHTHLLKKMGYAFGDRLTIETHPFIKN